MSGDRADTELFDAYYFAHGCGRPYQRDKEWLEFFGSIADRIVSDIAPKTVLDAGCAVGFLVEALRERGVEAYGIDISEYAIDRVHEDVKEYCWVGSVTDPLPQSYDLIVCIEVLEHLQPADAQKALANLCQHTDDILFSSAPSDYGEPTHYNVQPPEYWAESLARLSYFRDVDFDASFITPWAARFRKRRETLTRLIREYERKYWELWKGNSELRVGTVEMRNQLASHEETIQDLSTRGEENRQRVEDLGAHLNSVLSSRSWRLMEKVQQLRLIVVPQGSRRERLLLPGGNREPPHS
ncbi:MAG: methyltransferase domain-containing protein [Anaerolineales bacterium]